MHITGDETVHIHTHTHDDGTTHSHPHVHDHDHPEAHHHHHDHEGCGQSVHCGEGINCAECGHEHVSPREELMALMQYMVNHNTSHANELAELAKKLKDMGEATAFEQIMAAVSDFEKGNLRLSTVLTAMRAEGK